MKVANDCTQKAVVSNKAIQDLQQTMDQLAVAKTIGLDLMSFFIAVAIVAGIIIICATKAAGDMARHITAIAGVIMLLVGSILWIVAANDGGSTGRRWPSAAVHRLPQRVPGHEENTIATMNMRYSDGWGDKDSPPRLHDVDKLNETDCAAHDTKDACRADAPLCKWTSSRRGGAVHLRHGRQPLRLRLRQEDQRQRAGGQRRVLGGRQLHGVVLGRQQEVLHAEPEADDVDPAKDLFLWKDGYTDEGF